MQRSPGLYHLRARRRRRLQWRRRWTILKRPASRGRSRSRRRKIRLKSREPIQRKPRKQEREPRAEHEEEKEKTRVECDPRTPNPTRPGTKDTRSMGKVTGAKGSAAIKLKSRQEYTSPLDAELISAWRRKGNDPETEVEEWVKQGVPKTIKAVGIFPPTDRSGGECRPELEGGDPQLCLGDGQSRRQRCRTAEADGPMLRYPDEQAGGARSGLQGEDGLKVGVDRKTQTGWGQEEAGDHRPTTQWRKRQSGVARKIDPPKASRCRFEAPPNCVRRSTCK